MRDTKDAGKRQPQIAQVLREACEDDSDTIYQPAPIQTVAPRSDAASDRPTEPQKPAGVLAGLIEFIVRRRRRAR
jgi:hypothetical protein